MKAGFCLAMAAVASLIAAQTVNAAGKAWVKGRIVDEDGKPLEGVAVRANDADTETGADGSYSFEVPEGPVFLSFNDFWTGEKESWMTYKPRGKPELLMVKSDEKVDLGDVVYYRTGAIIEGTAMMDTGYPAVNARIYIATHEGVFIGKTDVGKGGEYSMRVPLARSDIPGYSLRVHFHEPSTLKDFIEIGKLEMWKANRVDVKIASEYKNLNGKISVEGRSPEGVKVLLYKAGQKCRYTFFPVITARADGTFMFYRVPHGRYVIRGCSSKTGQFTAEASVPCDTVQVSIAARSPGSVEGRMEVLVDGKPAGDVDPDDEKKGVFEGVFLADQDGNLQLPILPVALADCEPGKRTFRVEGLSPGKRFFHVRPCQKIGDFTDVEDASESSLMWSGRTFTHEGFYLVDHQPPPEEMFRGFGAEIVPGATARVEKKFEYTMEEVLKMLRRM